MKHSLTAYISRLPTEALADFLQKHKHNRRQEYPSCVMDEVIHELSRRRNAFQEPQLDNGYSNVGVHNENV